MASPTFKTLPAIVVTPTIGLTPVVVGTTDPRLYDRTLGAGLRS